MFHHHQHQPHPQDKFQPENNRTTKSSKVNKKTILTTINKQQVNSNQHQKSNVNSNLVNRTTNQNFLNLHSAASLQMPQLDAVIIRNLTYEAGRGDGKRVILNKINLTVPEGSIYGLLGPSGCGKTTMLRCVVGRIKARNGSVLVFGFRPGDGNSEVPGRDVGYMPQDISIYEDFTIEETLQYFGKINRMHSSDIKKRIQFLLQFLDLPSKKRLVVNLSGGQKRRVSLAAALVHSPPLLILDEPTVGVDPLLRQSIWKHLVTLTQTERISVIITTHYIEEARQANVVGLMRHGKILAEDSPEELMRVHQLTNLEDVFLKLCVTDSSRRAATLASTSHLTVISSSDSYHNNNQQASSSDDFFSKYERELAKRASARVLNDPTVVNDYGHRWTSLNRKKQQEQLDNRACEGNQFNDYNNQLDTFNKGSKTKTMNRSSSSSISGKNKANKNRRVVLKTNPTTITTIEVRNTKQPASSSNINTTTISGLNRSQLNQVIADYTGGSGDNNNSINEQEHVENFSSENENHEDESFQSSSSSNNSTSSANDNRIDSESDDKINTNTNFRHLINQARQQGMHNKQINNYNDLMMNNMTNTTITTSDESMTDLYADDYLAMQAVKWAARRSNALSLMSLKLHKTIGSSSRKPLYNRTNGRNSLGFDDNNNFIQWWKTLMAVTWKNYIRLRRNPPVLVFQFMLPAIQVILFCLCIGGEPFDVPVAIVNDELVPRSSLQFLNGLDKRIIRQIKYDNLSSAIEAVKRGTVWGAIHIPDKYSQNLQSRLIMGEEVSNGTISNGTIRVYPDLTNLHLALALETTFRETFINFARDSLEEMGYDRSLADSPIQVGKPVYGSMKKDGYLEFMAPGVVISISYVMATGLTALAFILERRDGLLERSLVSGVQTSQILLAHAINQVVVMIIQIFLVLGCTFFVFEIPSRGPFFWVVLLILLQGCTGMGFGLLVSAICKEENTAVMMVVGTFYTNLILAGIIWPIEAMPHWLRPVSYAQPQTLPTDTLRHILSRGWGITESGVLLGFAVTIGWLIIFLLAAGFIFKYSR